MYGQRKEKEKGERGKRSGSSDSGLGADGGENCRWKKPDEVSEPDELIYAGAQG